MHYDVPIFSLYQLKNVIVCIIFQSAVRAAIEGRVLILEGIEKAERNVLPVLNNLLENREMHLEDGRFLIPAHRYNKLLKVFKIYSTYFQKIDLLLNIVNFQGAW